MVDSYRHALVVLRRLDWRSPRVRIGLAAVSVLLVAVATTLLVIGLQGQANAPQPPAAEASPLPTTAAPSTSAPPATTRASPAAAPLGHGSRPIHIDIPAIHVTSDLLQLGLTADRTIQVPPLSDVREAGWYRYSPIPGVVGPSVILGHIDSARLGKGVFFDLGELRRGDAVSVLRADDMMATFSVTRVVEVAKAAFPTNEIYGNTADPQLRLITCGGKFNSATGNYEDNIIAFGTLTSLKHT